MNERKGDKVICIGHFALKKTEYIAIGYYVKENKVYYTEEGRLGSGATRLVLVVGAAHPFGTQPFILLEPYFRALSYCFNPIFSYGL